MKTETIYQVDYRVKCVIEKMSGRHFSVCGKNAVCRSYWLSYVRLTNKVSPKTHFNDKAPESLIAVADAYIDRVVSLSKSNNPKEYNDGPL